MTTQRLVQIMACNSISTLRIVMFSAVVVTVDAFLVNSVRGTSSSRFNLSLLSESVVRLGCIRFVHIGLVNRHLCTIGQICTVLTFLSSSDDMGGLGDFSIQFVRYLYYVSFSFSSFTHACRIVGPISMMYKSRDVFLHKDLCLCSHLEISFPEFNMPAAVVLSFRLKRSVSREWFKMSSRIFGIGL